MNYNGTYCSGTGDPDALRLIDRSFEMFHASSELPNLHMNYNDEWDTMCQGFIWGKGWWIQNYYGLTYAATVFLSRRWRNILQHSLDLFWDRIGDGKRCGADSGKVDPKDPRMRSLQFVGPDGCLGDAVVKGGIQYRQGDARVEIHDWFYEATAAGVMMQAELLLQDHDPEKARKYLPLMERSCAFIEGARDPRNNLFLVGPACNLLAPSYGGSFIDGKIGKGYLAGLSVTYIAALSRMKLVYHMTKEEDKFRAYDRLEKLTRESLKAYRTEEGYLVKSIDPNGVKHGVFGASQYGYLEGVANIDAVAFEAVDPETARSIYNKIASVPQMRPYGFLVNNYPRLGDTYSDYLQEENLAPYIEYGHWVDGGCWGTVEGRAILAYLKLGRFEDAFRSAAYAMQWAEDYRMDAPFCQAGANTYNFWSDPEDVPPVSVLGDNYAIPAALIRGLFEYNYDDACLTLIPHVPPAVEYYVQKEAVVFGKKDVFIAFRNGAAAPKVRLNGKRICSDSRTGVRLEYDALPDRTYLEIDCTEAPDFAYPFDPGIWAEEKRRPCRVELLPDGLAEIYRQYAAFLEALASLPGCAETYGFAKDVVELTAACAERRARPVSAGRFRPMTDRKKEEIVHVHDLAAVAALRGFERYMERCRRSPDPQEQAAAALFDGSVSIRAADAGVAPLDVANWIDADG